MALFYAKNMKRAAILGRRGSFHEEAALAFYQDIPLDLQGFDSFEQMLAAYDSADVDAVVIAVENTLSKKCLFLQFVNELFDFVQCDFDFFD